MIPTLAESLATGRTPRSGYWEYLCAGEDTDVGGGGPSGGMTPVLAQDGITLQSLPIVIPRPCRAVSFGIAFNGVDPLGNATTWRMEVVKGGVATTATAQFSPAGFGTLEKFAGKFDGFTVSGVAKGRTVDFVQGDHLTVNFFPVFMFLNYTTLKVRIAIGMEKR